MQPSLRTQFLTDGFVHVPQALDTDTLKAALECWQWSMVNPGPSSARLFEDDRVRVADESAARGLQRQEPGFFYQDISNPHAFAVYEDVICSELIRNLLERVLPSKQAWFLGEQVFLKEGATPATGWHQDISDIAAYGDDLIVFWIPFDAVDESTSLGLVPGSHRGPVYSSIYGTYRAKDLPQEVDSVSFACEPGDVVVFHMGCLHGGAPTRAGQTRRALALRFVGDDAFFRSRTHSDDPRNGQAFRTPRMRKIL